MAYIYFGLAKLWLTYTEPPKAWELCLKAGTKELRMKCELYPVTVGFVIRYICKRVTNAIYSWVVFKPIPSLELFVS